jgi:hypothetical protein
MICNNYNEHIRNLLLNQQVLWKCKLSNGSEAWSDFDVPDQKDPWSTLRVYCNNNNINIVEVYAIIPFQAPKLIFSDPNGLDNILLIRGTSKNIDDSGETVYSFMTFGKLEEDGLIHINRYYWPECLMGTNVETRLVTDENKKLLYKKIQCEEGCKCQIENDKLH